MSVPIIISNIIMLVLWLQSVVPNYNFNTCTWQYISRTMYNNPPHAEQVMTGYTHSELSSGWEHDIIHTRKSSTNVKTSCLSLYNSCSINASKTRQTACQKQTTFQHILSVPARSTWRTFITPVPMSATRRKNSLPPRCIFLFLFLFAVVEFAWCSRQGLQTVIDV